MWYFCGPTCGMVRSQLALCLATDVGIYITAFKFMFIDVFTVVMMEMIIMQVIAMVPMSYAEMAATGAMHMGMISVYFVCFHKLLVFKAVIQLFRLQTKIQIRPQ